MSSSTKRREILPVPKDPDWVMPTPTDAEFLDTGATEDEALLQTGAWEGDDDEDDDAEPDEEGDAI